MIERKNENRDTHSLNMITHIDSVQEEEKGVAQKMFDFMKRA